MLNMVIRLPPKVFNLSCYLLINFLRVTAENIELLDLIEYINLIIRIF